MSDQEKSNHKSDQTSPNGLDLINVTTLANVFDKTLTPSGSFASQSQCKSGRTMKSARFLEVINLLFCCLFAENNMDFNHLFLDEDEIESVDMPSENPYTVPSNDYVLPYVPETIISSPEYNILDNIDCTKCQKRQDKSTKKNNSEGSETENTSCNSCCCKKVRERRCYKPKYLELSSSTRIDTFNMPGPSRSIDFPVDQR